MKSAAKNSSTVNFFIGFTTISCTTLCISRIYIVWCFSMNKKHFCSLIQNAVCDFHLKMHLKNIRLQNKPTDQVMTKSTCYQSEPFVIKGWWQPVCMVTLVLPYLVSQFQMAFQPADLLWDENIRPRIMLSENIILLFVSVIRLWPCGTLLCGFKSNVISFNSEIA